MIQSKVFAQIIGFGHREIFRRCVERYSGDAGNRGFICHNQWLAMAFAQLTYREAGLVNARITWVKSYNFRAQNRKIPEHRPVATADIDGGLPKQVQQWLG